jgi:hypothetical protein
LALDLNGTCESSGYFGDHSIHAPHRLRFPNEE